MAPRPGGEADKIGNRYEAAWAISHALYCLNSDGHSLTCEHLNEELGKGTEFFYTTATEVQVHQVKRQAAGKNYWSIAALNAQGIFSTAAKHIQEGRSFHFVSQIGCGILVDLADKARPAADLATYVQSLSSVKQRTSFDELAAAQVLGSTEKAWLTLKGMHFVQIDETVIDRSNGFLAQQLLEGATGELSALALGDILLNSLGTTLRHHDLVELLAPHGISPRVGAGAKVSDLVRKQRQSWQDGVTREQLRPPIPRSEATQLLDTLTSSRVALVVGTAGGGKSSVLQQAVEQYAEATGLVLAFRLDRLVQFASTTELGRQLGFDMSPATALTLAAAGGPALLVLDQLDAVSLASGRIPESFDVVVDLLNEAASIANLRVVLACREFDVDNDHRIRALAKRDDVHTVAVSLLSPTQVDAATTAVGLDPAQLSDEQRTLLQTPLHLVLLSSIADHPDALKFQTRGSLFDAFWTRKQQTCRLRRDTVRFSQVIGRLANEASDRQVLSVPEAIFDADDLTVDLDVLVSEHVLTREAGRVAFFHETFFDYAFARQWQSRKQSLTEFLTSGEQELFRRGQVRQILQHLLERNQDQFLVEVEAVLTSPEVRFHIKEAALSVLGALPAPTTELAEVLLRTEATDPTISTRLRQSLRRPAWLTRFHEDGHLEAWLDDPERSDRAIDLMMSSDPEQGDLVASVLEARASEPEFGDRLRWLVRVRDLSGNRPLFDLLLKLVSSGGYHAGTHDLWLAAHGLGQKQPLWVIELLKAYLIDQNDALETNDSGRIKLLDIRDHQAGELVSAAAEAEPYTFAETIVPYILAVAAATARTESDDRPVSDAHYCHRYPDADHDMSDLDDALLASAVTALGKLVASRPDDIRPLLDTLETDPSDVAQYLLYRALTSGGDYYADWAATLLMGGGARLKCGYGSDPHWVARELVRAIAPAVDDEKHTSLEVLFCDLRNEYESRYSFGRTAFTFLTALDEDRLTETGRRRLGEFRRKFKQEKPTEPVGVISGTVGSPISQSAAEKMLDDQWLKAMAKHEQDRVSGWSFVGGAVELAHVLHSRVVAEPVRFAKLATQLTPDLNPEYSSAILRGLGDVATDDDGSEFVYEAVRHIAGLGHDSNDRWLGRALQHHQEHVPGDIVTLLVDRALNSTDPVDNTPVFTRNDQKEPAASDLRGNGMNTARGALAEDIGDLLIVDVDGSLTDLVRPHLHALAADPVLSVRSCTAHLLSAALRHARKEAVSAFAVLADTDDFLLAADLMRRLMLYIGNVTPDVIDPYIDRMLASEQRQVRQSGGWLGAYAALEWDRPDRMTQLIAADAAVRSGAARMCTDLLGRTSNIELAGQTLTTLMDDEDDAVRKEVAKIAPRLRDSALKPYEQLLEALIDSPSYVHASTQLLYTLEHAPDRVDGLALRTAQRFVELLGVEAADMRTHAAADAHQVSQLVVRGLAQSRDKAHRSGLLDVLDELLKLGVYAVDDAIAKTERL